MDRAYASGAAGTTPAAPVTPSVGYPQAANPGLGAPATKPGPYWYYMITEEIRGVIAAAGITPDQADVTQLVDAILALLTAGLANAAFLNVAQTFSKAQRSAVTPLVDGATINADLSLSNDFSVTLGGNRTLTFTNAVAGQSGTIFVTQDATGSRTLAYTGFKFYGGVAPTLTTAANAIDHLHYKVGPGGLVTLTLGRDSK